MQAKFQAGSFLSASFWQHNFDKYSEAEQSAKDKRILVNSLQSYLGETFWKTHTSKYLNQGYSAYCRQTH